jgi:hypothetical protein
MVLNQLGVRVNALCSMATLCAIILQYAVCGQADSAKHPLSDSICDPKVAVSLARYQIIVCLNRYEAGNDSCADIILRIQKPYRVDVRFNCASDRKWRFDTVVSNDPMTDLPPMRADVAVDDAGILKGMSLVFGPPGDSTMMLLNDLRNGEIPKTLPDTTPAPIAYVLLKTVYRCVDLVERRTFIYPPGYMRREPIYNYPELSMFHYGGAIKMPTDASVAVSAFTMNYWHLSYLPPLVYDEKPHDYIDDQKPKPPKKQGFIKIRPLR